MKTQLTIASPQSPVSLLQLHFLWLTLTLITACSLFKEKSFIQTDSLQKRDTRREVKTSETVQSQAVRIFSQKDTSDKRSFTEIFPEGFFNYSTEEGFSGNAKRVVMNERTTKGSMLNHADRLSQNSNRVSDLHERERILTRTGLKEKSVEASNFNLWYLLGLLLVFAGVYFFRNTLQE